MPRVAVGLEYAGSAFCGWQSQAGGCGVQDVVQKALLSVTKSRDIVSETSNEKINEIADANDANENAVNKNSVSKNDSAEKITVHASGRTDAGVHAALQIVHFNSPITRPPDVWRRALNYRMPSAVRALWAQEMSPDFHARYSAQSRCYSYYVSTALSPPAILHGRIFHSSHPLSQDNLNIALAYLQGEHDFSSFRAASCQANSPVRIMTEAKLHRRDDLWEFRFRANGFLHHMLRNIMGALFLIGTEQRPPEWLPELLSYKDRTRAPKIAPAHGLYLCGAEYPTEFALPELERTVLHLCALCTINETTKS